MAPTWWNTGAICGLAAEISGAIKATYWEVQGSDSNGIAVFAPEACGSGPNVQISSCALRKHVIRLITKGKT
jgi:hypothetical protein